MSPDTGPLSHPLTVAEFPARAPQRLKVSFEFSPPRTEAAERTLWETVTRLAPDAFRLTSADSSWRWLHMNAVGLDASIEDVSERIGALALQGPLSRAILAEASPADVKALKEASASRTVAPEDLKDFTIMLSNFGTIAGRYATPLVVPPAVAILGSGVLQHDVVAVMGGIEAHLRMPLSLTFDHRCVTGGEAARFLAAVIKDLRLAD